MKRSTARGVNSHRPLRCAPIYTAATEDAAKLAALESMYPRRTKEQIITELLTAALRDLENCLPYEQGARVVTTDEMGDPVYEDIGPTPTFLELSREHLARLKQQRAVELNS